MVDLPTSILQELLGLYALLYEASLYEKHKGR
jgi:hypothetical protein